MGINGLNTFLKEVVPECLHEVNLNKFNKCRIAIDTSIYLYKFLYKNDRFIEGFFQQIYRLLLNGIVPIYIFDGQPPVEKNDILVLRKEKRIELKKNIELLEKKINDNLSNVNYDKKEDIIELNKLKKKNIVVTNYHRETLKTFLDLIGIQYYQANEEADIVCNSLYKMEKIDLVLSDDMDLLVSGTHKLLRNFNVSSNKIIYYNLDKILNSINLTNEQWIEFCILSGCDYCQRIPGFGIKNAYKFIKKYNSSDKIFEVIKSRIPEGYINKFNKAKEIFNKIDDTNDLKNLVIKKNEINKKDELLKMIENNTNLTRKQIDNRLKIISLV